MGNSNLNPELDLTKHLIRFEEMIPCKTAFIDAKTPGSDEKENFCLIGAGVAENPGQVIHINANHGFNVGAARQPKGCKNSHHSHDTEEVFMIHSGKWEFTWGETGSDGSVVLEEGDVISIPSNVFRGFENVGDEQGFLFSILGLNANGTAGRVIWAPYVFEQASEYGLVLLEDGRLIDTSVDGVLPEGATQTKGTSKDEAALMGILSESDMSNCILRKQQLGNCSESNFHGFGGVSEKAIIGIANIAESIHQAPIGWPHNFHLRHLELQPNASVGFHSRQEEEVIIVHKGELRIALSDNVVGLNQGDVFTVQVGSKRSFYNPTQETTQLWVIRGGNQPRAAMFC